MKIQSLIIFFCASIILIIASYLVSNDVGFGLRISSLLLTGVFCFIIGIEKKRR